MRTDYLNCDMRFDGLDIADIEGCRRRVIRFLEDPGFDTAIEDLNVTAGAVGNGPAPRAEGSCTASVSGGSGGWGGSVGCGIRF